MADVDMPDRHGDQPALRVTGRCDTQPRPGVTIEVAAYDHLERVTAQRDALVALSVELGVNGCDGMAGGCLEVAPSEPWDWCDSCTIHDVLVRLDLWFCPHVFPGRVRCELRPGHDGAHRQPTDVYARCSSHDPDGPWRCSKEAGHEGDHSTNETFVMDHGTAGE